MCNHYLLYTQKKSHHSTPTRTEQKHLLTETFLLGKNESSVAWTSSSQPVGCWDPWRDHKINLINLLKVYCFKSYYKETIWEGSITLLLSIDLCNIWQRVVSMNCLAINVQKLKRLAISFLDFWRQYFIVITIAANHTHSPHGLYWVLSFAGC